MRKIVIGQRVEGVKVARAKQLRRQMTAQERVLWQYLRANRCLGLQFRRQQVIDGFIADFYCQATGLVIEVDGAVHDQQQEYDAERDRILSGRDLCILRLTNDEIDRDIEDVLRRIQAICGYSTPAAPAAAFPLSVSGRGQGEG
jgi:very-short-patch-repair endonuclease